ncbi:hypothetical protein [Kerstersia similis]|uniref:hypothetical protein n=1 Tax=Kerstersia similis TaxID=206505 RepID=UPI0039EEC96C
MAMFSSSKRPVFKPSPYDTGKRRHRMPRWLAQMLFGAIIGAAGWYFLQNSYGPKRLTVTESQQLTQELNAARLEAQRLRDELDALNSEHSSVSANAEQWQARANRAEALSGPLQQEIDALIELLPADPRGYSPGISGARFAQKDDALDYQVVLLQPGNTPAAFKGTLELVIDGRNSSGRNDVLRLEGPPIDMTRYQTLMSNNPLPAGFQARQVTVRVLDEAGKQRAMRVLRVR